MFELLRNSKDVSVSSHHRQIKNDSMFTRPEILAGVSHEVRTQMNAIVAFSYLINNNVFNETERREFSEQIIDSCEQLVGLFENFLEIGRAHV